MADEQRKVDLNLFRIFDAIYINRSITQASFRIGMSQPAVSNALARLRQVFQDRLFIRTSGGMQPTPMAKRIHPAVRQALLQLDDIIEHSFLFDPLKCTKTFRFAMTDYGTSTILPRVVPRISARLPNASIRIRRLDQRGIIEQLALGEIDLAFSTEVSDFADIYATNLFEDRFICLVRYDHPRIGDRLTLADLQSTPHALFTPHGGSRGIVAEILEEKGLGHRTMAFTSHAFSIPSIISGSDAIAIIPSRFTEYFTRLGEFRVLEVPLDIPRVSMKQYWHLRTLNEPANVWLRTEIQDLFLADENGA